MKTTSSLNLQTREKFRRLIVQKTGLEIREQNLDIFDKTIIARTRKLNLDEPENYFNFLTLSSINSQKEWDELVSSLTNNESYFFRDQGQFKLLKETILPELIERKKINKTLRICSAGCSTGPEPYSLAILLKELIPNIEQWKLLVLGVDINQDVLDVARKGVYSPWSFRRVNEEIKEKYFHKIGEQYEINQEIKQLLKFEVCNLVENNNNPKKSDFSDIDLIICRNVFIYFSQPTIEKILDNFYEKLQPSGYLLTGHAEIYSHNLGIKKFKKKLFSQSLIYQKPKLGEVIKATQFLSPEKKLSQVKLTEKKDNQSIIDVVPKSYKPLSKFTINLLESLNQSHDNTIKKSNEKIEIQDIQLLLKSKNYDLVIQKLKNSLNECPNDLNYLYLLAETYADIGQYKQAINYCNTAIEIEHSSLNFHYLLVQVYEEIKDFEQIKKILTKIIYLDSNSVYGYFKLGNFYQDKSDFKKATKMYQTTLKLLENFPHNHIIKELDNLSVEELIIKLSNLKN